MNAADPATLNPRPATPGPAAPTGSDPWAMLRAFTDARIALGRTGGSPRTATVLDFRLAHAHARDAVHAPFDGRYLAWEIETALLQAGISGLLPSPVTHHLRTAAADRATYLADPNRGRRLDPGCRDELLALASRWGRRDLAVLVSDGLSAQAAHSHAVATVTPLLVLLAAEGWTLYPVFIAPFGRVKLQDEVGELLGARHTLMLLGERPGLDSPDSLGAYFTHAPRAACRDADRNCVSNIRPKGLPPEAGAKKLALLLSLSAQFGLSGVALKDSDDFGSICVHLRNRRI